MKILSTLILVACILPISYSARTQTLHVQRVSPCVNNCYSTIGNGEKPSHISSTMFRLRYPSPENLNSIVEEYKNVNFVLFERATKGLRTQVKLFENGKYSEGYDEYFSRDPRRYREVRESRESIIFGNITCIRQKNDVFHCDEMDGDINFLDFGLPELTPESILSIVRSDTACGNYTCKSYKITQADAIVMLGETMVTTEPKLNYSVITLIVSEDGAPFSFRNSHWVNGKLDGPETHYFPLYDFKVGLFNLPGQ